MPSDGVAFPSRLFLAAIMGFSAMGISDVGLAGQPEEVRSRILSASEVTEVAVLELTEDLTVTGTARAAQKAIVSSRVSGIAKNVSVRVGDAVTAGDLLVEIDTSDLDLQHRLQMASVRSAKVALDLARSDLDRQSRLRAAGHVASTALDAAQAEVDRLDAALATAEAQLELAALDLSRAHVTAPISGIVSSRSVEPGQLVQAGSEVFEIIDLSHLEVEVVVPFAQSLRVAPGMKAKLSLPRQQGREYLAEVERIAPELSSSSRAARIFLSLPNEDGSLRSGSFMTGRIEIARQDAALAVPAAAVVIDNGTTHVLRIRDGKVQKQPVGLAPTDEGSSVVQVREGLLAGDVVLAAPLTGLAPGDAVEVRK